MNREGGEEDMNREGRGGGHEQGGEMRMMPMPMMRNAH